MSAYNALDSIIYSIIKTLNYGFMLVAMSFNLWIIITMALGLALGNMIF